MCTAKGLLAHGKVQVDADSKGVEQTSVKGSVWTRSFPSINRAFYGVIVDRTPRQQFAYSKEWLFGKYSTHLVSLHWSGTMSFIQLIKGPPSVAAISHSNVSFSISLAFQNLAI